MNLFGTTEYAYEELIAEISSCFMCERLGSEPSEEHIKNHKAYVQSWIASIREKPEALIKAIREAEKVAGYLELKAALITENEFENIFSSSIEVSSEKAISAVITPEEDKRDNSPNLCIVKPQPRSFIEI